MQQAKKAVSLLQPVPALIESAEVWKREKRKIEITVGARKNGNPPPDAIVRGPRRVALYQIDAQPTSKNDRCQLHIQW